MPDEVSEQITVAVPASRVYEAVSDVRRMARWSPECVGVWVWRRQGGGLRGVVPPRQQGGGLRGDGAAARFVGFNRRGPLVWFTTCRVVTAEPGREFAFDVTTFGMPVSRWSYRLSEVPDGTEVTEHWQDRRSPGAYLLGRIFTGRAAGDRPQVNSDGMRTTLARLKRELEATG